MVLDSFFWLSKPKQDAGSKVGQYNINIQNNNSKDANIYIYIYILNAKDKMCLTSSVIVHTYS